MTSTDTQLTVDAHIASTLSVCALQLHNNNIIIYPLFEFKSVFVAQHNLPAKPQSLPPTPSRPQLALTDRRLTLPTAN